MRERNILKQAGLTLGAGGALLLFSLITYIGAPLPDDLFAQHAASIKITDRRGILLRETTAPDGGRATWLTYPQLPETVVNALIEVEDHRFFSHPGVDAFALGRAVAQNLMTGRIVSGASTITQQLVKQRFGYPRTAWGKCREMLMALRVERKYSKAEILTEYLNRVSFSNQAFGIEAAARLYFGKPAAHLSLAESVFLVGLIQAPSKFNPYRAPDNALRRQRRLLAQMRRRGAISDAEYQLANNEAARLISKNIRFKAPHFCDVVQNSLTASENNSKEIRTTLNYYLQAQIEGIVARRIDELKDYHVTNAAVLVLDNEQGDILAYVGSKDYFDDSISGQVNGVLSLRQPGSTLKPFTYQLALERAYTTATLLPDIKDFPAAPRSFLPENYDRKFHGPVRLREALACSYNIPAFRLVEQLGVETLHQRLRQYGFASLRELSSFYGPGLTLGNGEVTLMELTRAYAILARRGRPLRERFRLNDAPQSAEMPLFAPRPAYLIADILADRQAAMRAFGEETPLGLPFVTAVKTGTSKDYRDNWTVGFTRDYTVGVWVGNFDGTPMRKVSGITGAAPIYRDVMLTLYRDYNPLNLLDPAPDGIVSRRICPLSGKLVQPDCPHGINELFLAENAPTAPCDMHRAVWVNAEDGLLTDAADPRAKKTVFTHFPPLYQTWAHEMEYPTPPTQLSPAARADAPIRIAHPNDGDVYALDPILRPEFQTVQLSAVVEGDIPQITWYVDGEAWERVAYPFRAAWPLAPGSHRIHAESGQDGQIVRSEEISVFVVQ